MPGRHVSELLSAFCQDELPADEARAVAAHLNTCARCRSERDEIRLGIELAGRLVHERAPEALWAELAARLDAPPKAPPRVRAWRTALLYATAGALVAATGLGLWLYVHREHLEIVQETTAPTAFEAAARDAHVRRTKGGLAFDYVTTSPEMLRGWIRRETGLDLHLAIERPPEDAGRFHPLGATIVQAGGARAALVGYEIDSRPVTLLSARLQDVQGAPPAFTNKKKVAYRLDAERGLKVLTWGAGEQAYVLVSDLPGIGTEACSICHTAPERRKLIRESPIKN